LAARISRGIPEESPRCYPVDLAGMPDAISRRLFEALRLEIRYDHTSHVATCQTTLTGDTIGAVARASREATASRPRQSGTAQHKTDGAEAGSEPRRGWSV
jgi:site-specific DNA recombinase